MTVSSKTASLESKLNNLTKEKSNLEAKLEAELKKKQELEEAAAKTSSQGEAMKKSFAEEVGELKREKEYLEASFESEKADLASEKRKNIALADQLKDRDRRYEIIDFFIFTVVPTFYGRKKAQV